MIIYYSGDGDNYSNPEVLLAETGNVMLTYAKMNSGQKPCSRGRRIMKARRRYRKEHGVDYPHPNLRKPL